jgi:hypothetical protein
LTVCDTLKACYLVNILTRDEIELSGSDKFELDPLNNHGYSIRCDVNGENELDFIKFYYDGVVFDEFAEPRYMYGDSDGGAYLNKVDYLSTCGQKRLKIEGNVWSKPCFEKEFFIDVSNGGGKPCVSKDTSAPVKPPTVAPVKSPTDAPINAPKTSAPVQRQTQVPAKPPVQAPIRQPVTVTAPTKPIPIPSPIAAPVVKPAPKQNCDPVKAPVPAPIKPTPVCPYPQQWINGCCKTVCKNDFICPLNTYRIANRECSDSFDDYACKYGYYKSTSEAKCIRHSWCLWY